MVIKLIDKDHCIQCLPLKVIYKACIDSLIPGNFFDKILAEYMIIKSHLFAHTADSNVIHPCSSASTAVFYICNQNNLPSYSCSVSIG